jgi:hypothetical protein
LVRLRVGRASHRPWTGCLIALTLVGVHLTRSLERSIEVRLMALATAVGAIVEMVQIATGTYRFTSGTVIDALQPSWLLTMWAQCATTFRHSLRTVISRPPQAALFGSIGGPIAFLAGERLGAVTLLAPLMHGCSAFQSAGRSRWWSSLPCSDGWRRNETRLAPVRHDESSTTTTATKSGPGGLETGDCQAILDSSPRVCPESSPTIASFPLEFGKCDGLKNRRLSLFFLGILAGTRRHRAQCARKCARCREAHPRCAQRRKALMR